MKIPYNVVDYFPPAPVLMVRLSPPEERANLSSYSALVDTGADGTFVPTSLLEQLNVPLAYMTNVRSHFGENLHRVPIHKVDFVFSDAVRLPNIEVVSDDWGCRNYHRT